MTRQEGNTTGLPFFIKLKLEYASDSSKTMGLFNIDLFIPILTYIFGQAILNGPSE